MRFLMTLCCFFCVAMLHAAEPDWLNDGRMQWKSSGPLVAPEIRPDDPCYSVKDPTVVFYEGKYHVFATIRSEKRTHQIEYLTFVDWKEVAQVERHVLKMHPGYFCAPQVFYFTPHKKWYLICQASDPSWKDKWGAEYGAAFSTTDDITKPDSWSPLQPLGARRVGDQSGLDFWVICDANRAYLFFTTLDGKMWREETLLEQFPHGWSEPGLALEADIFEASHTYKIVGQEKYLTVVEAQNGPAWRYYKAYLADRLDGPWTPLADSHEKNFAGKNNVTFPQGEQWADSISHVELIRSGFDEKLEIDPNNLRLVYQGVLDRDTSGIPYGQIPWRLGVLEERDAALSIFLPQGTGLAARFKADTDITEHPDVIFADNFESGELGAKWDSDTVAKTLSFSAPENELCGQRCLKVEATLGKNTGGGFTKWFVSADRVFVRFYVRFDPDCDYIHHFVTLRANKGLRGGDKWSGFGGAGLLPAGGERFSTALEPVGNWGRLPAPGVWNFYSYWHEMKESPDKNYWGNSFQPDSQQVIEKDRWICAEFMLKHNTPGQADGEQAFWIDGKLLGHWRGINWRKTESLKANALTLESYITDRWTKNETNIVYFDNVVIAREYIGPAGPVFPDTQSQ